MSLRSSKTENIENQSNPFYEGVSCQQPLALYESIPAEGGIYYDVLDRKQLHTTMDPGIINNEESQMTSYSKLELDDSEIKPEKNPAYITTPGPMDAHIQQSDS